MCSILRTDFIIIGNLGRKTAKNVLRKCKKYLDKLWVRKSSSLSYAKSKLYIYPYSKGFRIYRTWITPKANLAWGMQNNWTLGKAVYRKRQSPAQSLCWYYLNMTKQHCSWKKSSRSTELDIATIEKCGS